MIRSLSKALHPGSAARVTQGTKGPIPGGDTVEERLPQVQGPAATNSPKERQDPETSRLLDMDVTCLQRLYTCELISPRCR